MSTNLPEATRTAVSDRIVIDELRTRGASTIGELVERFGVTATAVRQRLNRLMNQGFVQRAAQSDGRGRPRHYYRLTPEGVRSGGDNYEDLASVLWSELRSIEDPEVKNGLLKRIVSRLAAQYREKVVGSRLLERMQSLAGMMNEREVAFAVQAPAEGTGDLPVLTALACPYPELAEQDRSICSMEKMLFSEILGESVKLSECRLTGGGCCTFEVSTPAATGS